MISAERCYIFFTENDNIIIIKLFVSDFFYVNKYTIFKRFYIKGLKAYN